MLTRLFITLQVKLAALPGRARSERGATAVEYALMLAGIAAVIVYLAAGAEPWLWAAVPACVASGLVLFAVAWLCRGQPAGG